MKQTGLLLTSIFLFLACVGNDDNDPCEGVIADPIVQSIFIELVDAEGNNLIENGTYPPTGITAEFNGTTITGVVFTEIEGLENLISLNVIGPGGETAWLINLNDQETDTLILDLTLNLGQCGFNTYAFNSATYNGEVQQLVVDSAVAGDARIRVVREP